MPFTGIEKAFRHRTEDFELYLYNVMHPIRTLQDQIEVCNTMAPDGKRVTQEGPDRLV